MILDELIFKRCRSGYCVHAARVPDCIATGRTIAQASRRLQRALQCVLRRRKVEHTRCFCGRKAYVVCRQGPPGPAGPQGKKGDPGPATTAFAVNVKPPHYLPLSGVANPANPPLTPVAMFSLSQGSYAIEGWVDLVSSYGSSQNPIQLFCDLDVIPGGGTVDATPLANVPPVQMIRLTLGGVVNLTSNQNLQLNCWSSGPRRAIRLC